MLLTVSVNVLTCDAPEREVGLVFGPQEDAQGFVNACPIGREDNGMPIVTPWLLGASEGSSTPPTVCTRVRMHNGISIQ